MIRKQAGRPTEGPLETDFGERDLARRGLYQDDFEARIQALPESVRVLLRFARERGLLPSEANGETKRVSAPRAR